MAQKYEPVRYDAGHLLGALNQIFTVIAGEGDDAETFMIHKNVLTTASPFFEAACKPEWMKLDEQVIRLPGDDPETVRVMICWMYHKKVFIHEGFCGFKEINYVEDALGCDLGILTKLYVLGQNYQMPKLCNDAIDGALYHRSLREEDGMKMDLTLVPYVYENTPEGSPFRKFFINSAKYDLEVDYLKELKGVLGLEFISDIASSFIEDRGNMFDPSGARPSRSVQRPIESVCAIYHVHSGHYLDSGHCMKIKEYELHEYCSYC